MIAVELDNIGGALRVVERSIPTPDAGELLVRIEAVGLNWSDLLQRDGVYPGGPKPPFIVGQEAAGIIVAHGPGVSSPSIGARVSLIGSGLAAELVTIPASRVIAWDLDVEQRAALPIALLTSHFALVTCGHAERGETVVVHAAAGGLGHIAVQVARELGLRVIATCSPAKRAHVIADVVGDYGELAEIAKDRVELVIDGVGGDVFRASLGVLKPRGRIVIVGASSGQPQQIDAVKLVHRSHAVIGAHLRHVVADASLFARTVAACVKLAEHVRARVTTMPVAELEVAYARLASREIVGKLVVSL